MKHIKTFSQFINESSMPDRMDPEKKKRFIKFLSSLGSGDFYEAFTQGYTLKTMDQNTAIDYAEAWAKFKTNKYVPKNVREYFYEKWIKQ